MASLFPSSIRLCSRSRNLCLSRLSQLTSSKSNNLKNVSASVTNANLMHQFCSTTLNAGDSEHFIQKIMAANKKWRDEHNLPTMGDAVQLHNTQTPIATLLSCCDSRVPTSALGIIGPNEMFSVKNIGNQFSNSVGSFRYGIEQLKTKYAIIMGHTNCGAIRAAAADYRGLHTMVQQEVISLVRVIRFADSLTNSFILDDMPFDIRCNVYSEINVDYQIMRLLDDWQISQKIQSGNLVLIGMMFDVHNVYNKGYGKLHVTNINGDRDVLSLRRHPLLTTTQQQQDDDSVVAVEDIASRLFSYSASLTKSVQYSHH